MHWTESATTPTKIETLDTGGGVINTVITLGNGDIIVVCADMVALYRSEEDYQNGESVGEIFRVYTDSED